MRRRMGGDLAGSGFVKHWIAGFEAFKGVEMFVMVDRGGRRSGVVESMEDWLMVDGGLEVMASVVRPSRLIADRKANWQNIMFEQEESVCISCTVFVIHFEMRV